MALLSNIVGFSLFGLATRFGQLGIQKRNLFDNPGGHIIAMAVFGYGGYWAYRWDQRAAVLLAMKREEIRERRVQAGTTGDA
ncbi:hypothetical protein P691DRAFT_732902 [Macrolepiota fuliginosa MF-IS2]|uniref:Uncharacterized protein n=1 Tax=Macrolepiota fuliginosa MF-IS2 TaxID=1400762 RepID=A0A9P5XBK2_9AGAR|nr:hypothetical protein P691DRAFT_732902 [Macrolepiota fuliginosa MF-IS2]